MFLKIRLLIYHWFSPSISTRLHWRGISSSIISISSFFRACGSMNHHVCLLAACLSWFPNRAESCTSMLLMKHLFSLKTLNGSYLYKEAGSILKLLETWFKPFFFCQLVKEQRLEAPVQNKSGHCKTLQRAAQSKKL